MKSNLISVIVPVYNVEKYLNDCVSSIVNQTYKELEIILVDDGSSDLCPSMCDEWAKRDKRIIVIHKKNGGLSDARNAGIEISTGEYIGFVDSDDYIELNMYELMLAALKKNDADYCACGVQTEYEDGRSVFRKREFFVGDSEQTLEMLYNDNEFPVWSWCKLSTRELWNTLRFPVGKNYEDAFTTYIVIDNAKKIVRIPEMCYHYRIRANSIMTENSFSEKNLNECCAWEENYLFVKVNYPRVAPAARYYWLEHLAATILKIPSDKSQLNSVKKRLVWKLKRNIPIVFFESGPKKAFSLKI